MPRASDFQLFSVQAVVFTPALAEQFRTSAVLSSILPNPRFAARYDGEVESAPPMPRNVQVRPGELREIRIGGPAVKLASADGQWRYQSTPARTDSFWFAKTEQDNRASLAEITGACIEPLLTYPAGADEEVQIGRIALVVRRWLPLERPATALASQFCLPHLVEESSDSAPLRHSHSFRLDNLKKYDSPLNGRRVNSWIRFLCDAVNEQDGIFIEQDLNTLNEETESTAFQREEIERFFAWVPDEMQHIVSLYFQDAERT